MTFARLRPHDIEYYRHPEKVIAGIVRAPSCYLTNATIAIRHVFAVVLSEFFRHGGCGEACVGCYNDFMCVGEEHPQMLDELRRFIADNRESIDRMLADVLPDDTRELPGIGLGSGEWIERLTGDDGRLMRAHSLLHDDWDRLNQAAQDERAAGNHRVAGKYEAAMEPLEKKGTIKVLAESGVLPKYGFPTDLVTLSLVEQQSTAEDKKLDLSRGLRQAIKEYAPGAVVVADKKTWKSVGILKPRQRPYEVRRYGECTNSECGAFVVPIDAGQQEVACPVCGQKIKLSADMLIPSNGFRGRELKESPAGRRRRSFGSVEVKFEQDWGGGANPIEWRQMPGGRLGARHAANGRLFAINKGPGRGGFVVCSYCGAAAPKFDAARMEHEKWCKSKKYKPYSSLGTDFRTDVLELTFDVIGSSRWEDDDWLSLRWALVQAAVSLMNVPESEIGATNYRNHETKQQSVLIYDNVPGGAGRALQLSKDVDALLEKAYEIVDTCDCDEDTCCYGCLCNYYNQREQDRMSRGAARDILGALLGKSEV